MQPAAYFAPIFGRSAQELLNLVRVVVVPVEYHSKGEYQVEALFINFSVSTARSTSKKGCRQGPGSGNLRESRLKATISQQQYWYQNLMKITY